MRKAPGIAPPPLARREDDVVQTREYALVTPLFGGGVEPGVADPVTPVRGSGVRGQLRFWWRASRGGRFGGSLDRMREAEAALWGAAGGAGPPTASHVQISVHDVKPGADNSDPNVAPQYAAFPLRETEGGGRGGATKPVRAGVRFALRVSFRESDREDVEAALWAWETFGGLGARTRRGFGALHLVTLDGTTRTVPPAEPGGVTQAVRDGLARHVVEGGWPDGVPHLARNMALEIVGPASDPHAAWLDLIAALKGFRQRRLRGERGMSMWPEPDAIRRLANTSSQGHGPRDEMPDKFPRAAFGLPIVFKFKDDRHGDPAQSMLEGAEHGRHASRLVLRPLACGDDRGVGLAAVLAGPEEPPGGVAIKTPNRKIHVETQLDAGDARAIEPMRGGTDVLLAFLDELAHRRYR